MPLSQVYRARYAGRAQALRDALMYEKTEEGIVAYSADGKSHYHVDLDIIDGNGEFPICDCAEFQRNIRMIIAEGEGKRVTWHGGRDCKHIRLARDVHHLYKRGSLLDELRALPEGKLKREARGALKTERQRIRATLH
jgi:hypothetical protein